jgi:hypothetical protein
LGSFVPGASPFLPFSHHRSFVFFFHITFVPHRSAHSRCRYVSSQLESIAASKLGPLKLPTNRKSEPEHQPLPSPDRQAQKPRSSSADDGRLSGEGGERARKKSKDRETAQGADKDKLQAIYSAGPRVKHQSVWTKENLLRGGKKLLETEPIKETRASVSHDIRQVKFCALRFIAFVLLQSSRSSRPFPQCSHLWPRSSIVAGRCRRLLTPGSRRTSTCAGAQMRSHRPPRTLLRHNSVVITMQASPRPSTLASSMLIRSTLRLSLTIQGPIFRGRSTMRAPVPTWMLFANVSRRSAKALRLQAPTPRTCRIRCLRTIVQRTSPASRRNPR